MTLGPNWKRIALPAALIVGAVGGSAATMLALPRAAEPGKPEPRAEVKAKPTPPAILPGDVKPPLVVRNGGIELVPPPDFFDLPAPSNKGDGTDPPIIKRGQILLVEVLEALPGRPITGERMVRPDGTISLGFYGDLPVAGLDRLQIKVKVIERLREYINDEALGLARLNMSANKYEAVMPVHSNRVYIDESINFYPPKVEAAARPQATHGSNDPSLDPLDGRIRELEGKLDAVLKELRGSKVADAESPR